MKQQQQTLKLFSFVKLAWFLTIVSSKKLIIRISALLPNVFSKQFPFFIISDFVDCEVQTKISFYAKAMRSVFVDCEVQAKISFYARAMRKK